MFDAHVHLDFLANASAAEHVRRARGQGVTGFAVPGVSPAQWPHGRRVAKGVGGIWGCGVHPEYASMDAAEAVELARFVSHDRPDFIGETGLDARLEAAFSKEAQEELFLAHIALAESTGRALVVHSVRRHARVLELLRGREVLGMIHGFIGSAETAEGFFARGWYVSIGKGAMRSPKTQRALIRAPLERLLLESDEPGEASDIPSIVDWLSQLRGVAPERVGSQTHANALRLFAANA